MKLRMPEKIKPKHLAIAACVLLLVILLFCIAVSSCKKKSNNYFYIQQGDLYLADGAKSVRKITSFLGA